MSSFRVSPDSLTAAAARVDDVVSSIGRASDPGFSGDAGHPDAASAITRFVDAATTSGKERAGATQAVASSLRRTAALYADADRPAAPS